MKKNHIHIHIFISNMFEVLPLVFKFHAMFWICGPWPGGIMPFKTLPSKYGVVGEQALLFRYNACCYCGKII